MANHASPGYVVLDSSIPGIRQGFLLRRSQEWNRTVSLGMETMPACAHGGPGQEHPCLTVSARQGSFTHRWPTRGSAVNEGVSRLSCVLQSGVRRSGL
jgi:hypothetical protein